MYDAEMKITLQLIGPVLTHSTAAGPYGIDSPMAKDRQDRYYLPGTLVKGRLREAPGTSCVLPIPVSSLTP
ncbi:MAG: hypothetical protein GXP58_12190 [Deltaproteobacteria bacterium]|nr:hypothetical protein [Deltaproteobacteria bacterium]